MTNYIYFLGGKMSNLKSYYKVGKIIGLNNNDIDILLKNKINNFEKSLNEFGPIHYPGGFYSAISIKEF